MLTRFQDVHVLPAVQRGAIQLPAVQRTAEGTAGLLDGPIVVNPVQIPVPD